MTRRVLVTGAGGFVGRALVQGFARRGWHVVALDRAFEPGAHVGATGGAPDGGGRIDRVTSELGEGVPPGVPPSDLVVHAAWVTTDPDTLGVSRATYDELNLAPLEAVLAYAGRCRPDGFVFLSSSGVFAAGDGDPERGLTDTHPARGSAPYATAKRAAEARVFAALGTRTAAYVVRLGYLYGPGERARPSRARISLVAGWLDAARAGRPLAIRADDPRRDWTFTADLAPALERVVGAPPASRPVHLCAPHVWRDSEWARCIAERLGGRVETAQAAPGRNDAPVKPPMTASDLPSLRDFVWTDPPTGLDRLLSLEVSV